MREIKAGEYYRHFKGGQYQVTAIARDANTEEKLVVYQALYGEEEFWVRPYEEFASEVDREKYPDAEQTWRFEKIEEPQQMNPLLLRFLEAESYRDKLELFQEWSALLSAGLPMDEVFRLLARHGGKRRQVMCRFLEEAVLSGLTLSEAMEEEGSFSSLTIALIHTGEESGRLADELDVLASWLLL